MSEMVSIDEFGRLELRVGTIVGADDIKGADRLLQLTVSIGEAEPRTVVAGIKEHCQAADLIGRRVVVVANLQPAIIRGVPSRGMVLAAVDGDELQLVTVDGPITDGARVQ